MGKKGSKHVLKINHTTFKGLSQAFWFAPKFFRVDNKCARLGWAQTLMPRKPDNILEAEKIKGTVYLAIGDGSHLGGKVSSDIHQDFVIPRPTLLLDGKTVIKHGEWLF